MKRVEFSSGDILLEGVLSIPEGPGSYPLVVVCHPHPLYGGSMENNVVAAVCASLGRARVAWLKFNFRGVGRSGGAFADGLGEREDARAAISYGERQPGVDPERIGLCGYSFGSLVAFSVAAEDTRVRAVAGIAPFVTPNDLLDRYRRPKLLLCGTEDEYISSTALEQVSQGLPEPKELVLVPGVDHFWAGKERAMAGHVARFFVEHLVG